MKTLKYCCTRFAEAVNEKEIKHSSSNDETEWFIDGLWHLYYCPFCGSFIKGKGYGKYEANYKEESTKNRSNKI
jgi:hypothetical protein